MLDTRCLFLMLLAAITIQPAFANEPSSASQSMEVLQALVQTRGCASCHGTRGQGNTAMKGPKLAGQSAEALSKKLRGYRNRTLHNPTMNIMAYRLSDQDIVRLAEYFSRFE